MLRAEPVQWGVTLTHWVGTVMLEGHRPFLSLAVGVPGPLSLQWRPASPHPGACGSVFLCRRNRCSFWEIASCHPCAWQPRLGGPSHSPGRCFCWNQPLAGSEMSFLRGWGQEVTNAHWALRRTLPSGPLLQSSSAPRSRHCRQASETQRG